MKTFILLSVLFASSSAAPISEDSQATILEQDYKNNGDGSYDFSYKTSNGQERSEYGILVNKGQPNEHIEVRGSYSYIDQDGKYVEIHYTADEKGYHIDDSPPIEGVPIIAPLPAAAVASLLG